MRFTASSARDWRKTETAVPRLSILEVREQTYSTKRKVFGIIDRGMQPLCRWIGVFFSFYYTQVEGGDAWACGSTVWPSQATGTRALHI